MNRCVKGTRFDLPSSRVSAKAAMRAAVPDRVRVLDGGFPGVRSPTHAARVGDISGVLARSGPRPFSEESSQNQSSLPTPGHRPPSKQSLVPVVADF